MALTRIQLFWRIVLHWIFFALTAAFITSLFSTFYPLDRLRSYYEYGFEWNSLGYFRYTMYFFTAVSAVIAGPSFIINIIAYFRAKPMLRMSPKFCSLVANISITLIVLAIYSTLGITLRSDLITVIAPIYILTTILAGLLFLPKTKHRKLSN